MAKCLFLGLVHTVSQYKNLCRHFTKLDDVLIRAFKLSLQKDHSYFTHISFLILNPELLLAKIDKGNFLCCTQVNIMDYVLHIAPYSGECAAYNCL